jgi:hypothetical protein
MAYSNTAKIIKSRDLEAISWVNTGSPVGLSDRAMRLFQVLKSSLRMNPGSTIMKTTVAELARSHVSAHLVGACSPSTVRRALAELENKGYISRSQCRLGNDSKGLKIVFELDRWAYWLQTQTANVTPMPTSVHITPRQSSGPGEDRTSTTPVVNSQYSSSSVNNMQKANKKIHKYHPILFTIWACLKKDGIRVPHQDPIYRRAKLEIEAAGAGVDISNHTGVPWGQHEKNWRDMLPPTRETFARSQILPFFRPETRETDMCDNVVSRETMCDNVGDTSPEQIRALIEQSLASVTGPKAEPLSLSETPSDASPASAPASNYPDVDMSDPTMQLLVEMRDKVRRARGVNTS